MRYAVIEIAGKQYLVEPGMKLKVAKLPQAEGEVVELKTVLLKVDEGKVSLGEPYLTDKIAVRVIKHGQTAKKLGIRYQPKGYRRNISHRQPETEVEIMDFREVKKKVAKEEKVAD